MDLNEALAQISEIRLQMARAVVFRGYRAVTAASTGIIGLAAAGLQAILLPEPAENVPAYLTLWIATALLCLALVGIELLTRCRRSRSALTQEMTWNAIEQLLPAVAAGGLLTVVLVRSAPESLWMLPGLWQIVYSLGIFASCRFLPRATFWMGVFYLGTGLACLALAQGQAAFSPWAMGLPFGVGQLLSAAVLYWSLERDDGAEKPGFF